MYSGIDRLVVAYLTPDINSWITYITAHVDVSDSVRHIEYYRSVAVASLFFTVSTFFLYLLAAFLYGANISEFQFFSRLAFTYKLSELLDRRNLDFNLLL